MRMRIVLMMFSLLAANIAAAKNGSGSDAGNGGGLAEKNVTFAYMNLEKYADLCLGTGLCRLMSPEKDLLAKIRGALPAEKAKEGQIVFRSEKDKPGFFQIEGQLRVAKTGNSVGDPIYVNTDLLYYPVSGEMRAVDIPLSVSILVHELGHHQGVKDHAALDVLGSKLQALLLTQSQRAEFWNGNAALITYQLNAVRRDEDKKKLNAVDQLLLENDWNGGSELVSLTEKVLAGIRCPEGATKPLSIRFYNLHEERGVTFDKKNQILKKPVQAWYILSCSPGTESDHGNVEIELGFKKLPDGSFRFQPELTQVSQISCLKDVRVCK